jgi:hypothetical protein
VMKVSLHYNEHTLDALCCIDRHCPGTACHQCRGRGTLSAKYARHRSAGCTGTVSHCAHRWGNPGSARSQALNPKCCRGPLSAGTAVSNRPRPGNAALPAALSTIVSPMMAGVATSRTRVGVGRKGMLEQSSDPHASAAPHATPVVACRSGSKLHVVSP